MYEIFEALLARDGVTVADVCRATGIRESTMSNWKKRKNLISGENAILIADYFGVSLDFLLKGFGKPKNNDNKINDILGIALTLYYNEKMNTLMNLAVKSPEIALDSAIAVLNTHIQKDNKKSKVLTAEELPKLGNDGKFHAEKENIESTEGVTPPPKLSHNSIFNICNRRFWIW